MTDTSVKKASKQSLFRRWKSCPAVEAPSSLLTTTAYYDPNPAPSPPPEDEEEEEEEEDCLLASPPRDIDYSSLVDHEPQFISVTYSRDSLRIPVIPLGLFLESSSSISLNNKNQHSIVIESILDDNTTQTLLSGGIPLRKGDILEQVNHTSCKKLSLDEVVDLLQTTNNPTTLHFQRPSFKHASHQDLMIQQATVLPPPNSSPSSNSVNLGIEFDDEFSTQRLIRIQRVIRKRGFWFANLGLSKGHVVLKLGDIPYCQVTDATQALVDQFQSQGWASITTIGRPRSKLRKTAVTVGASTMVGAGAVIMATPLHPVGHLLAASGVKLLLANEVLDGPNNGFLARMRRTKREPAK